MTLLQILTLDSWTNTARLVQNNSDDMGYILLVWFMYVLFILLAPLMMLNCLNAIFVEGVITKITHKKLEKVKEEMDHKKLLLGNLEEIFRKMDTSGDGYVSRMELNDAFMLTRWGGAF